MNRRPSVVNFVYDRGFESCGVINLGFVVRGVGRRGYCHFPRAAVRLNVMVADMRCNI